MAAPETQVPSLVPGMHVQPGVMTFACRTVDVGGQKAVVVHVEHSTGSTVLVMDRGSARSLADQLTKEATGLEVATRMP